MRIGAPARNHGVTDEDIGHAVRNAMRRRDMGENLSMLSGPASDGRCWRSASSISTETICRHPRHWRCDASFLGSLTEEVINMRHTDDEIERAAKRFEQLTDELDPATGKIDDTEDLRAVAVASEATRADEARLRGAVEVARAQGRSWNSIALALGVSRKAARQRVGRPKT
jgi:bacterioferritin-associated ferredoxin